MLDNNNYDNWLEAELEETLDELYEEEFSAPMVSEEIRRLYNEKRPDQLERRTYYRNLLRLQSELIKLQDWVKNTGAKVLIICEGRDMLVKVALLSASPSAWTLAWLV